MTFGCALLSIHCVHRLRRIGEAEKDFVQAFGGLLIDFGMGMGQLYAQYTDPARRRSIAASPTLAPGARDER